MTTNLCIIITGQLRTFFDYSSFTDMYQLSKHYYNKILVICVLNSDDFHTDQSKLISYFNDLEVESIICNYKNYTDKYDEIIKRKLSNPLFLTQKEKYFSYYKNAHIGLPDPDLYTKNHSCPQQHHIQIGIEYMLEYISKTKIDFDMCMKTRFDAKYPTKLYPHIPTETNKLDNISFNEHNKNKILKRMKENDINSFEKIVEFNKTNKINPPNSHIYSTHDALSFGGMVCYNYESLYNIQKNGFDNILYAFNDYYFFSKKDDFIKFKKWIDESCLIECANQDLYNHYFCPENQFVIFCINNGINILMYPECLYDGMVHR